MALPGKHLLVIALAFTAVGPAFADSAVYIVTGGQQFGSMDLNTGRFSQIGPNAPEAEDGLAPGPNGSLLTLTVSGNLDSINPATGVTTKIGPTGLGDCTSPTSPCGPNSADTLVAFGGKLYATDVSNNLYVVNPSTGTAKLIGPTGIPPLPFKLQTTNPDGSIDGIDTALFVANGKLYETFDAIKIYFSPFKVIPVVAPNLWQINPDTGRATEIGPTTLTLGTAAEVDGTVYAFENMTN
jgi:outer membrane protein assembly factor BamB